VEDYHKPIEGPEQALRFVGITLYLWQKWATHLELDKTDYCRISIGQSDGTEVDIDLLLATARSLDAFKQYLNGEPEVDTSRN
jgi:hypothetical protein